MADFVKENYEWVENLTSKEWDDYLSALQGHPLQSAKWGNARKLSCGIKDHRWLAFKEGSPYFIARFEQRRVFKFLKIAWVPKGPIIANKQDEESLLNEFLHRLKKRGFFLCATNPWEKIEGTNLINSIFYTIWLDLAIGKEKLWMNLHKQCRYDVKRSKKLGLVIEESESMDDLHSFYKIYELTSVTKGFNLSNSSPSMPHLFINRNNNKVKSHLFVARHEGNVCGGAFIIHCGENIHYIWGAVNRSYSHLCIGEALQWEIIEWGINHHCKKYDLEGISMSNSGVDKFKKKLGGTIISCPSVQIHPLNIVSKFILNSMSLYSFLKPKIGKCKNFISNKLCLWKNMEQKK